jgi:uncharacterized cupin superfamily protein
VTDPINVGELALESDASDPPGYQGLALKIGPLLGSERLVATVYELPAGQAICPYHYEYPTEEWLLVLEGRPAVRTPNGEERLEPGDIVCFPAGPDGAHKVGNDGPETARVLFISTADLTAVAIYPDSGKVGVWPPGKLFREADAVDYWVGEVPDPPAAPDPAEAS